MAGEAKVFRNDDGTISASDFKDMSGEPRKFREIGPANMGGRIDDFAAGLLALGLEPGGMPSAEFAEYRPWKNSAQFDKEIGKYVGQQETDRLKQYVFIPPSGN